MPLTCMTQGDQNSDIFCLPKLDIGCEIMGMGKTQNSCLVGLTSWSYGHTSLSCPALSA
jgi:hypothetical protein